MYKNFTSKCNQTVTSCCTFQEKELTANRWSRHIRFADQITERKQTDKCLHEQTRTCISRWSSDFPWNFRPDSVQCKCTKGPRLGQYRMYKWPQGRWEMSEQKQHRNLCWTENQDRNNKKAKSILGVQTWTSPARLSSSSLLHCRFSSFGISLSLVMFTRFISSTMDHIQIIFLSTAIVHRCLLKFT